MATNLFGFHSLEVCVAAAVSQSKKAVSAVVSVVIGIGLLFVPIESVQAQHFDGDLGGERVPVVKWRGILILSFDVY